MAIRGKVADPSSRGEAAALSAPAEGTSKMTRNFDNRILQLSLPRRTFLKVARRGGRVRRHAVLLPEVAFGATRAGRARPHPGRRRQRPGRFHDRQAQEAGRARRASQYRTIYAQDPATYESIFQSLGDAGAAVVVTTFNEVAEPIKAVAPKYPKTKWIQIFGDPMHPPIPNVVDGFLRLLSGLLPVRHVRRLRFRSPARSAISAASPSPRSTPTSTR